MLSVILIPAFNPDDTFASFVDNLARQHSGHIIIIDDGSKPDCDKIFLRVDAIPGVILLRHSVNLGKGAAIKTGLDYFYRIFPDHIGVVTADADGQHSLWDISSVAQTLNEHDQALVLGCRKFDQDVPFRSLIGNKITRFLMRRVFGLNISDTQSGLRGIPRKLIPALLRIPFNRYEYETEMLILSQKSGIPIFISNRA